MNLAMGWAFLAMALVWGVQAVDRLLIDDTATAWHGWANLFATVAFTVAGVGYLYRYRRERAHGTPTAEKPDDLAP